MKNRRNSSRLVRRFRKASQIARWAGRRLTANWRALPDFIVIGAQKGGTTPLSHYLMEQHPSVIPPTDKEVHFYDRNYEKGIRWYKAHFPLLRLLDQGTATGEASPYYLAHPHVPGRIALNQPSVKMIALLRDPKSRAISHYHMSVRKGRETRATLDRICGFIGIAPIPDETDISPWKVRAYPREVSSELNRHLDEYFDHLIRRSGTL